MRLLSTLAFVGAVSASVPLLAARQAHVYMASGQLFERQIDICVPVRPPVTCERSCGPGFVECVGPPNCYNPGRGDSCCSNGRYCREGFFCTDAGCCENGLSLEECGATITLSVIPPPPPVETPSPSEEPPSSDSDTTTQLPSVTSSETSETSPEPTPEPPTSTSESESATSASTSEASISPPSNGTSSVPPPVPTAGAGRAANFGIVALLGGLGAVLIAV